MGVEFCDTTNFHKNFIVFKGGTQWVSGKSSSNDKRRFKIATRYKYTLMFSAVSSKLSTFPTVDKRCRPNQIIMRLLYKVATGLLATIFGK